MPKIKGILNVLFHNQQYFSNFIGLIQFEGSGNWPDDLTAIKHIRTAFHIKIAECIRKELKIPARANPKWIDVFKVDILITSQFPQYLITVIKRSKIV